MCDHDAGLVFMILLIYLMYLCAVTHCSNTQIFILNSTGELKKNHQMHQAEFRGKDIGTESFEFECFTH